MAGKIKNNQGKQRSPRGQSLVEAALLLPILLLLVLGAMDFGRMFYTKIVLTNAAREGANYLAYFRDDIDRGYVDTFTAIQNEADSSNVVLTQGDVEYLDCCTPGSKVGIRVTKTIDLIFDGALQSLGLLGGPVELTSEVWMVVQ